MNGSVIDIKSPQAGTPPTGGQGFIKVIFATVSATTRIPTTWKTNKSIVPNNMNVPVKKTVKSTPAYTLTFVANPGPPKNQPPPRSAPFFVFPNKVTVVSIAYR